MGWATQIRWAVLAAPIVAVLICGPVAPAFGAPDALRSDPSVALVATIPLAAAALGGPAYYPGSGTDLYLVGAEPFGNGWVNVVASTSQKLIAAPAIVGDPDFLTVDTDTGNIYVTSNSSEPTGTVDVVSGATDSSLATVTLAYPVGIAFDTENGDVYAGDSNPSLVRSNVSVIAGSSQSVVARVQVGGEPQAITYDPLNGDLYVLDQEPYVGNFVSNHVTVISGTNNSVVGSIDLLGTTWLNPAPTVVLDPENGNLYAGGEYGVTEISGSTNQVVKTFPISNGNPSFVDPEGNVFVLQPGDPANVTVISGGSSTVITTFPIGCAYEMSYNPATAEIFSTAWEGCLPYALNVTSVATEQMLQTIHFWSGAVLTYPPTYDPVNREMYLTVSGGDVQLDAFGNATSVPANSGFPTLVAAELLVGGTAVGVGAATVAMLQARRKLQGRSP